MGKTRRLYRGGKGPRPKPQQHAKPQKAATPHAAQPKKGPTNMQKRHAKEALSEKKGTKEHEDMKQRHEKERKNEQTRKKRKQEEETDEKAKKQKEEAAAAKKKRDDKKEKEEAKKKKEKEEAEKKKKEEEEAKKRKEKEEKEAKKRARDDSKRARSGATSIAPPAMPSAPGSGFSNMGAAAAGPAAAAAAAAAPAPAAEGSSSSGSSYGSTSDGPYSPEEAAAADTVSASDYGLNADGSINCDSSPPEECPSEEQCQNQALYFIARSNAVANYRRSVLPPIKTFLETLKKGNIIMNDYIKANPTVFSGMLVAAPAGGDGDTAAKPREFNYITEVDKTLEGAVEEIKTKNNENCVPKTPAQAGGRRTHRRKYTHLRKTHRNKRRSRK